MLLPHHPPTLRGAAHLVQQVVVRLRQAPMPRTWCRAAVLSCPTGMQSRFGSEERECDHATHAEQTHTRWATVREKEEVFNNTDRRQLGCTTHKVFPAAKRMARRSRRIGNI